MSLLPFFTWCEKSAIGEAIRNSQWLFPVIESVHLLALVLIAGAVLVVDMRLFGLGLRRQPVAQLARDTQPWLISGLMVMLPTGILLFLAEATKCYYSLAFSVKMTSLLLALIFTFTIRRNVTLAGEGRVRPLWSRLVAVVSVALWSGVGIGGRWIGFS
jgi:hypothetical protein